MQATLRNVLHPAVVVARVGFMIVAWALLLGVVLQVLLAGASIFVSSTNWRVHEDLGWSLLLPVLLLLLLAPLARVPWRIGGLALLLLVLYTVQVMLVLMGKINGLPWLSALHPVNALAIFLVAHTIARRSVGLLRPRAQAAPPATSAAAGV